MLNNTLEKIHRKLKVHTRNDLSNYYEKEHTNFLDVSDTCLSFLLFFLFENLIEQILNILVEKHTGAH
jgi:hypothetical protein